MSRLDEWLQALQQWEWGTNTEPDRKGGRKPIMALDSTAGTGMLSHNNLLLGAQSNVDTVAAGRVQTSAGQDIRQIAGGDLELYAEGGIHATAGKGDVKVMAHGGDIDIGASRLAHLFALKGLTLESPVITLKTPGGQIVMDDRGIHMKATGTIEGEASDFSFHPGGGGGIDLPDMPQSHLRTDEQFAMAGRRGTARENLPYAVTDGDGAQRDAGSSAGDGAIQSVVQDTGVHPLTLNLKP
jgi:uncharacterized protein (DUF2345 family)